MYIIVVASTKEKKAEYIQKHHSLKVHKMLGKMILKIGHIPNIYGNEK